MVIVMISLIFFGMLQVGMKLHAEHVHQWAVFAAARSRIVGFNDSVVQKAWWIADLLNCGGMETPSKNLSEIAQVGIEANAIPLFLETTATASELSPQLSYAGWKHLPDMPPYSSFDQYTVEMEQDYTLSIAALVPMMYASFGTSNAVLRSEVTLENHFPFYLQVN